MGAFHCAALMLSGRLLANLNTPGLPQPTLSDFDVAQGAFPALTQDHDLVVCPSTAGQRALAGFGSR
ncbi:MAG: hypothetical protein ABIW36_13955 [Terrimesophilobacter sp.]